jgi:hypothetical protein
MSKHIYLNWYSIDKTFSTEKKALEYIEKVKGDNISDKYIEEFEVD